MKILHVAPSLALEWGGPARVVIETTDALNERGLDTDIFTGRGVRVGIPQREQSNVTTFNTGRFARIWTGYSAAFSTAIDAAVSEYDVVHIHELWHYLNYSAARAAERHGVPYVVTTHGNLAPEALAAKSLRKRAYWTLVQKNILEKAAVIQVHSRRELEDVRATGVSTALTVVPNGVTVPEVSDVGQGEFKRKYVHLNEKRVILFLGRILPIKGLELLAEAFSVLAGEFPDIHLIIAGPGEDGQTMQNVERVFAQNGVEDRITWTGLVGEAEKVVLYELADLFVTPSLSESFGLVAAEAMAAGVPVVMTRASAIDGVDEAAVGMISGRISGKVT